MEERFIRTGMLLGEDAVKKLENSKAVIFGIGGVGSYTAEGLARSGVGKFVLIDKDVISVSNINRQIHALDCTVGMYKTKAMAERILNINPKAEIKILNEFYFPGMEDMIDSDADIIIDAVDTVTAKIGLAVYGEKIGIPVISSMGTGNKLHPELLKISDIYDTKVCPLAKVMRKELRKRDVKGLKVVYSEEEPIKPVDFGEDIPQGKRQIPGSTAFVPSAAGMIIAGEAVRILINKKGSNKNG